MKHEEFVKALKKKGTISIKDLPELLKFRLDKNEEVMYEDECISLYIPIWFDCNKVFGLDVCSEENDDWINLYINIVADNELETLTSVSVGSTAYVITPSGQQINYVCVDAFDGHNDVTGYDALQKDDGTIVWGSAELIVYTCLGDSYNVRVACFNRA